MPPVTLALPMTLPVMLMMFAPPPTLSPSGTPSVTPGPCAALPPWNWMPAPLEKLLIVLLATVPWVTAAPVEAEPLMSIWIPEPFEVASLPLAVNVLFEIVMLLMVPDLLRMSTP